MWILKRIVWPNEYDVCSYSEEIIKPGDWYFQLFEDPKIKIRADIFEELKRQYQEDVFDYTELNNALSEQERKLNEKEAKKFQIEQKIYSSFGTNGTERRGY